MALIQLPQERLDHTRHAQDLPEQAKLSGGTERHTRSSAFHYGGAVVRAAVPQSIHAPTIDLPPKRRVTVDTRRLELTP